ncbi:MAG TPA: hypothetical protein VGM01_03100 [Ktedonobacteraceae bacterium]
MESKSSLNKLEKEEQENSSKLTNAPESKQESGPPRALGNQTELGDQTELNAGGDQPTFEPAKESLEHNEERKHSNSSADHHTTHTTKAGGRDPAGLHGG